ncbi:hypothetical protein FA13DRAFT_1734154 [Coprinellus micaceus]|uniref:CHAT domain-containing protein n=1 Tax=Coprinellus micaceus TaxID=71717 RepID=A0A4Y7T6Q0_COPMI|nr:hypothetical protein FA13DRAFT_1734154 [Coprinellus micaceus]
MDAIPISHPNLYIQLENLARTFSQRWKSTRDLMDIHEAVSLSRKALELALEWDPDPPRTMCHLANNLKPAVKLTPEGDPQMPYRLYVLGSGWQTRFGATGDISDITNAVSALKRAAQAIPTDSIHVPGYFLGLGDALLRRCMKTRSLAGGSTEGPSSDIEDEMEGLAAIKLAVSTQGGPTQIVDRLHGARMWARHLMIMAPHSPDVLIALDAALDLLALRGGIEQTIRMRHIQLEGSAGIAPEAASIACELERPDKALEWLEQGRCLVWNQINRLRTPLGGLHLSNPSLAKSIMNVSRRLESAGSSREHSHIGMPLRQKISLQEEARTHLDLAKQWDELLHRARAIPGFESFLLPARCPALLQDLPESGPVVVINVHKQRCDAIALRAGDEPRHIHLPNFSEQKANAYQRQWQMQLRSKGLRMRGDELGAADQEPPTRAAGRYRGTRGTPIRTVLQGLWIDVVKPILGVLEISKFEQGHDRVPPRIWWCPTGALSFLPIHAAGIYGPGVESETVLDYVVSSYTPTVSALTERVRGNHPIEDGVSGLFLTSQSNAPGASKIPGTTMEVRSVYKKAIKTGIRALKVEGADLTVDECLGHLEEFSSVHLACHGYQNPEESLRSKFRFHNGTLDLATVLRKDLKHADLAFLSACETSTGDEKLSDEAVHLAAGMLAAGYRRVVASMWSIGDTRAQEVAKTFYDYLWKDREPGSGTGFDGSQSAYALHHAIQKLRDDLGDTDGAILAWAPFVHFGY